MKKLIIINGSPRKGGNSDVIAETLSQKVTNTQVEIFNLREKTVKPCLACAACKKKDTPMCVQKDDMGELIPRLDDCDGFVLLTPIYFGQVNGPAKTFIDRLYCFYNPTKPGMSIPSKRGKKAAMIACCGAPADTYSAYTDATSKSFGIVGADEIKSVVYGEINVPGSCKDDENCMKSVEELAKWLSE